MASPTPHPATPPPPSEPPPSPAAPPPPAAPEGAVQLRTPSPTTAALIARLRRTFAHATDSGLCPLAAAVFAAHASPPSTPFTPEPHKFPGRQARCNCHYRPPEHRHRHRTEHPTRQGHATPTDDPADHQMDNLRTELVNMHQRDKMKACRERHMIWYKRSKARKLESNVRALFAAQYAPLTRPQQTPAPSSLPGPDLQQQPREQPLLGCQHYARNCKLKANCCGLFVSCRFCHDDAMAEDHEMDRFATETILCMVCLTEQQVGPNCIHCDTTFAHWYCKSCRFFENTPGKKVYHCNRCNICRLGEGLGIDNYHCDNCDACVSLESKKRHNCMSKALHANCPVCRGYLFTSTEPVVFMRCGHTMHGKCFDDYTSRRYQCPLCMHSLTDMKKYFEQIDEIVRNEPMPPEYEHKRSRILCNDCGNKCVAKRHFMYHKCDNDDCKSYNTTVLDFFEVKPATVPPDVQPQDNGQHIVESVPALHGEDMGILDVLSGDCSVAASSGGTLSGSW